MTVCLKSSITYSVSAIAFVLMFSDELIGIFTKNDNVIATASQGLKIIVFSLLFAGLPMLTGAYYQSLGKKMQAYVMFLSTLVFSILLFMILPKIMKLNGVWWSYTLASLLSAILSGIVVLKSRKKLSDTIYVN